MARLLTLFLVTMCITCCAAPPVPSAPNPNWARLSGEHAGCVSYAPRRREAVDVNIVLKPAFEEALVAQLDADARKSHKCWYETPTGAIRLFAGEFCGSGTDAFFEQEASTWKLVRTNVVSSTCHPIKN
jgi:hypothetical protein